MEEKLRELISEMLAEQLLFEKSYGREDFKDAIEEHISGAQGEFYKARVATKNGLTTWVNHWNGEVAKLLGKCLKKEVKHNAKFKNKKLAFNEVVTYLQTCDEKEQRLSEHTVMKDFKVLNLEVMLDESDAKDFWELVFVAWDKANS